MKEFITLTDVKINNLYNYILPVAPTATEKAPLYTNGETWLNTVDGFSYKLTDQAAGTWVQIETAEDAKINRIKENVFRSVIISLDNYFIVNRNADFSEENEVNDFPNFFNREDLFTLFHYESVWSNFTFASAGKTLTVDPDSFLGSLTNSFEVGDCVLVSGSRRNNGYYTIASVSASALAVSETIIDGSANCFVFLTDIPSALIDIIGRMIHFDVYLRGERTGLSSERIGTYSYALGKSDNSLQYPNDVVAGISAYEGFGIGGLSVFIN